MAMLTMNRRTLPENYDAVAAIEVTTVIAKTMARWIGFITFMVILGLTAFVEGRVPGFHLWFVAGTISMAIGAGTYIYFWHVLAIDHIAPFVEQAKAYHREDQYPDDEDDQEPPDDAWPHRQPIIASAPQPMLAWLEENIQADWFGKVDWTGLAEKVVLSGAGIGRDVLHPEVPHFVYSPRPGDDGPTFPEEMMRLRLASAGSNGYHWTNQARVRWQVLLSETDRSPLPHDGVGEAEGV